MARSRENLVRWSLRRAEEFLESAEKNLDEERLFPAAEEIFRVVERALELIGYEWGVRTPPKTNMVGHVLGLQRLCVDGEGGHSKDTQAEGRDGKRFR